MLEKPEYDNEFYLNQNKMMELRYEKIFSNWKLSWKSYKNEAYNRLNNNIYWIWIFLCGFEKFIQSINPNKKPKRETIYKDMNDRIYRIIGDHYQVNKYISEL